MNTMVSRSTTMPSVDDDAKLCTVATSLVIVDISVPRLGAVVDSASESRCRCS